MTVTYGTGSAPYLAIKVLHQIAKVCKTSYPRVYGAIINNTYVDDICTGEDSTDNALILQKNLIHIFAEYGLELKKWMSNSPEILERVASTDHSVNTLSFIYSLIFSF